MRASALLSMQRDSLFVHLAKRTSQSILSGSLGKYDPELGQDRHGQTLRLYIERCYVMKRDFDNLVIDDGWKTMSEIVAYLKAVECMPDLGEKCYADKSFFADVLSCFFSTYLFFNKHV